MKFNADKFKLGLRKIKLIEFFFIVKINYYYFINERKLIHDYYSVFINHKEVLFVCPVVMLMSPLISIIVKY